jgi:hypothetical protein
MPKGGCFAFSRLASHIRVLSKSGEKPALLRKTIILLVRGEPPGRAAWLVVYCTQCECHALPASKPTSLVTGQVMGQVRDSESDKVAGHGTPDGNRGWG